MTHTDFEHSPVSGDERCGFWSMLVVMLGFAFFSASMMVGVKLANGLTFWQFVVATLGGNLILGGYCALLAYAASRTGLSIHLMARRIFGATGAKLQSAILAFTQIGWFGVGVGMFAIPVTIFLMDMPELRDSWWMYGCKVPISGLADLPLRCLVPVVAISGALMTASAYFGMRTLKIVSFVAVPAILVFGGWSVVRALGFDCGSNALLYHTPSADCAIGIGTAISMTIGSFISGGTCTPDFARFANKPSSAALATVIAFFVGNSLMFFFGAVAAMTYNQQDIAFVLRLQGLLLPAIAVLGLNIWTTNDNAIYTAGLGLANITGLPKRHLVLVGGLLGTVSSIWLYTHFCGWLDILNVLIPPLGAVILVAWPVVNRGGAVSARSVFVAWAIGSLTALCGFCGFEALWFLKLGIPALNGMVVAVIVYWIWRVVASKRGV